MAMARVCGRTPRHWRGHGCAGRRRLGRANGGRDGGGAGIREQRQRWRRRWNSGTEAEMTAAAPSAFGNNGKDAVVGELGRKREIKK
jgi:hypothetical protein